MPVRRGRLRTLRPLYFMLGSSTLGCVDDDPKDDVQVSEGVSGDTTTANSSTGATTHTSASTSVSNASSTAASTATLTSVDATTTTAAVGSTTGLGTSGTVTTSQPSESNTGTATSASDTSRVDSSTTAAPSSELLDGGASGASSSGVDAATPACPVETALTGGQQYCSNTKDTAANGYGYELWAEGNGTGCMTVFGQGAAFKATWTDVEDFLARVGLDFDETRTHEQIGNIWADFVETQTGSEEGLTYVGIYGWTVDPLREFYILDDWGTTKPAGVASDGTPRDEVGTLVIDGETYDVWKKTRENKPSIKGDATFDQYFSIRRSRRQCGRISVSEHFAGWEDLGLPLGNLYEVKILVESQFNSGSVEFSSASVVAE